MGADVLAVNRIGQGRSMRRAITASWIATATKTDPERVLRKNWGRDEGALQILQRSAVSPASTTGGYPAWVDQIGPFRSLLPGSAALALFDASNKLDLTGLTTISVPNLAGLPPKPVFVAEGQPAPSVQLAFAKTVLGPTRKIMIISALTREVEEASADTASDVIGRVLADASTMSIDTAAFGTSAASAIAPAGLLYGVAALTASSATPGTEAMDADLSNLVAAIGAAGIDPSGAVYVCGPAEAMKIKLRSGPNFDNTVLMTLGLPAKSVACFAPAGVYSGYQGLPTVETAKEVVIHREDTTPLPIVGSPSTVASPTSSLWQTDAISIRIRAWCAWAAAPGATTIVNSVTW
jgi:hypothetical protein